VVNLLHSISTFSSRCLQRNYVKDVPTLYSDPINIGENAKVGSQISSSPAVLGHYSTALIS
jgi:hypothetical protein